jgi:adenine-specific DNA-methyltransferase
MALIDNLIAEVPNQKLRESLVVALKKLREEKTFGLVFEEHLPETVELPTLAPRQGTSVVRVGDPQQRFLPVIKADPAWVTVNDGEKFTTVSAKEVVVAQRFGDPIFPALRMVQTVEKGGIKPFHLLIKSENFHALQLLLYTHESKVDVIYIDPPYNTGARNWKYNNRYVDQNDQYRHSKWLSMMKKRLLIAKRLLKPDGVLIVTVDDYEGATLALLIDEVFRGKDRSVVVIKYNPAGTARNGFSRCHEYAYYVLNKDQEIEKKPAPPDIRDQNLRRHGTGAKRKDQKNMFFPIFIDKKTLKVIGAGEVPGDDFHPSGQTIEKKGRYEIWPIDDKDQEKRWYYSRKRVIEKGAQELTCKWQKGRLHVYFHTDNLSEQKYQSVWTGSEYDAGAHGGSLVRDIVGLDFPFPKSLYAVRDCLNAVVRKKKNAVVLDFFGGSGTTLHATCLLNAEDNGSRQCILVTNNEVEEAEAKRLFKQGTFPGNPEFEKHGICESITWPRCKYSINGVRDDGTALAGAYLGGRELKQGFEENIAYLYLEFLDPDQVEYGCQFKAILPILWVIAGSRGRVQDMGKPDFYLSEGVPFAVLLKEQKFKLFNDEIRQRRDLTHIFLVTDSEEAFKDMKARINGRHRVTMLYKDYIEHFKLNTTLIS